VKKVSAVSRQLSAFGFQLEPSAKDADREEEICVHQRKAASHFFLENSMNTYLARESAVIEAPAERLYDIIADYHEGHRAVTRRIYREELQQLAEVAGGD
jgi:hypothetical protein